MIPSVLAGKVKRGVEDFLRTTFPITNPFFHDAQGKSIVEHFLDEQPGIFKGPYVSVQLPFQQRSAGDDDPDGAGRFEGVNLDFIPYLHQEQAFARLCGEAPRSTLVATGTGSGKTECFLLPILEHCYRHRQDPGIKAILIYPMNALAGDQAARLTELIHDTPALRGQITAGLYVGGGGSGGSKAMGPGSLITNRDTLRQQPPDILLTNYKMLDYLLLRPQDLPLWQHNGPSTLRYLVVDELHTFDGAQGTDLTCLIRRLKARLKTPERFLCAVGTSATLGGEDAAGELRKYAQTVFGEPFDEGAVIGESRQSADEFLADSTIRQRALPPLAQLWRLDAERQPQVNHYIAELYELWFGDKVTGVGGVTSAAWRVALGERLKEHVLFRNLLAALGGEVRPLHEVIEKLRSLTPELQDVNERDAEQIVTGLLALISYARTFRPQPLAAQGERTAAANEERSTAPFLHVRVQLWLREMRRMVCAVSEEPRLRFADDLSHQQRSSHLPLVHCRDCGALGWAGMTHDAKVVPDLRAFYPAFFSRHPRVAYLFPRGGRGEKGSGKDEPSTDRTLRNDRRCWLCPHCLGLSDDSQRCSHCGAEGLIAVSVPDVTVFDKQKNRKYSHNNCPYCGTKRGLILVGSRAASLTSVEITQLFATPYNDDKKLLTFSDSVQDAAHRSGFFGARTFHFNVRTALQQYVKNRRRQQALEEVPEDFCAYWRERLGISDFIATFLAPDMAWMHECDLFLKQGDLLPDGRLHELVKKRIGWEIYSEYGFRARIGRTLEKSGCSVLHLGQHKLTGIYLGTLRMEKSARRRRREQDAQQQRGAPPIGLFERLQNEFGVLRDLEWLELQRFILGLCTHLKNMGAVDHPALAGYIKSLGNTYLLKRTIPWMPGFGPRVRAPAFLTSGSSERFERLITKKGRATWCHNWLVRTLLAGKTLYGDEAPWQILKMALDGLVETEVLVEHRTDRGEKVWALDPRALHISTEVTQFRCRKCWHCLSVAREEEALWEDTACLQFTCEGHYEVVTSGPRDGGDTSQDDRHITRSDYYGRLYNEGDVKRVFSAEHTGLLQRREREELEARFKADEARRKPCDSNLLSCTPTLEMGINIGDLSSLVLCAVPPSTSSYLQRIGRSGRRDGNALNLTVANARPHDLFFFAEPAEMLAGLVETPGVFLGAAAVLERQLTAYCFDRWVESESAALPPLLRQVLEQLEPVNAEKFPHNFLEFVRERQVELLAGFVGLFPELQADDGSTVVAGLRAFLLGGDGGGAGGDTREAGAPGGGIAEGAGRRYRRGSRAAVSQREPGCATASSTGCTA